MSVTAALIVAALGTVMYGFEDSWWGTRENARGALPSAIAAKNASTAPRTSSSDGFSAHVTGSNGSSDGPLAIHLPYPSRLAGTRERRAASALLRRIDVNRAGIPAARPRRASAFRLHERLAMWKSILLSLAVASSFAAVAACATDPDPVVDDDAPVDPDAEIQIERCPPVANPLPKHPHCRHIYTMVIDDQGQFVGCKFAYSADCI